MVPGKAPFAQMALAQTRSRALHSACPFSLECYSVLAIIEAAGWPVWPLILASVIAVAIIIERAYSLRAKEVAPRACCRKRSRPTRGRA